MKISLFILNRLGMSDFSEIELFKGKNLSDLFEEIYTNSKNKRDRLKNL